MNTLFIFKEGKKHSEAAFLMICSLYFAPAKRKCLTVRLPQDWSRGLDSNQDVHLRTGKVSAFFFIQKNVPKYNTAKTKKQQ